MNSITYVTPFGPLTVSDVLCRAREKIVTGWTRNVLARDAQETSVDPRDPQACCFCAQGALIAAGAEVGESLYNKAKDALRLAIETIEGQTYPLTMYNDVHANKAQIINVFDVAISLCKQI